jgi:hypothetical protein
VVHDLLPPKQAFELYQTLKNKKQA